MLVVSFVSLSREPLLIQSYIHKLLRHVVYRLALCGLHLSMAERSLTAL